VGNQIVWVDIPVIDIDRALRFYGAVLGVTLEKQDVGDMAMAVIPSLAGEASGCLFTSTTETPGASGPLIYLNCAGRLDAAVAEVEQSGGRVLQAIHSIAPHGNRAIVLDSEGNRLALHSH